MATNHKYAPYYWKHNKAADNFYNSGISISVFLLSLFAAVVLGIFFIGSLIDAESISLTLVYFFGILSLVGGACFIGYNGSAKNFGDELVHNQYKALNDTTKKQLRPLAKAYGLGKMNGDENRKFAILVQEKFKLVKDGPAQNKYLSALDMELATVEQEKEIQSIIKQSQKDMDNIMKGFR